MDDLNKDFAFVISAGRTGTKFLGDTLKLMIDDAFCVHEPDILETNVSNNIRKISTFGMKHMVTDRLRGKSGIRNLSQQFISGKLNENDAWQKIEESRRKYWTSLDENLIIESYYGWYGLLPVLQNNMPKSKIVVIVRHPATWIKSNMNWGRFFGKKDILNIFGHERLNPELVNDKVNSVKWKDFDPFEKLCWTWNTINELLTRTADDKQIMILRYEDLFTSEKKEEVLDSLLTHVTSFGDKAYDYNLKPELLNRKIHASQDNEFPDPENWDDKMKEIMYKHCQVLMDKFGYKE